MDAEQRLPNLENDQSKYRIYLVGFPEVIETQDSLPINGMIQDLVPEARVWVHRIFHNIVDPHIPDEDEVDADETHIENLQVNETDHQPQSDTCHIEINALSGKNANNDGSSGGDASNLDDTGFVVVDEVEGLLHVDGIGGKDAVESAVSVTSMAGHDFFSPGWIRSEALDLLDRIQRHDRTSTKGESRVILAGYGFGGIVVKQAIIIANTTPKFYNVALNIASLVFFATPHRSTGRLAWEEVLLDMLKASHKNYRGRLSQILSDLVDSVSQLSHVFYRFASKYPTTNFVQGRHADITKFNSTFEQVIPWKHDESDNDDAMRCAIDDKQESLRKHFAPLHILSTPCQLLESDKESAAGFSKGLDNMYLDTLQLLSPSRWALDETNTLDKPEEFSDLQEIYGSLLHHVSLRTIRGGSVQITGPTGHGRSAVMKLLLHKIMQESSVVIINNFVNPSLVFFKSLYGVLVSFIHQIISQRPYLFYSVRNLMAEILRHGAWSEQAVRGLLYSIFQHSRSVNFLVLIHDFESWPADVRSWWSDIQRLFPKSSQSACTFIISSHEFYPDFTPGKSRQLDLSKGSKRHKQILIANKMRHFLQPSYSTSPFHKGFSEDVELSKHLQKAIVLKAKSFEGSLASTGLYLTRLFRSFTLSSLAAIEASLSACPTTQEQLYEDQIDSLISKPHDLLLWATATLSWTLLAVRPLRVEELAVATAIHMSHCKISDIEDTISIDMERDLYNNLAGLVSVENRYVRIVSPLVKEILVRKDTPEGWDLGPDAHHHLSLLCLHYLQIVLSDERPQIWDECLSLVSHNHRSQGLGDTSLTFLNYACRFWPVHFLQAKSPDENVKKAVTKFLQLSNVAERWFRLYLLGNSLREDPEVSTAEAAVEEIGLLTKEGAGIEVLEGSDPKQSAIAMASYVGLSSIVCYLLDVEETESEPKRHEIRRGCLEHSTIFSDTTSSRYVDCVISNDDDIAVKELFSTDPKAIASQFPLHKAAWAGSLKVVQALLELLDDPAQTNDEGRTPLHMAAICGQIEVIRILVGNDMPEDWSRDAGIPDMINNQDRDLKTPLIIAAELGHVETAQYLVQSGANLTLKDRTGKTAVHYAVLHCSPVLETFIAHDEEAIYISDDDGRTPLHFAARYGDMNVTAMIVKVARESDHLTEALTACDEEQMTPLHHAAENGHTDITKVLVAEEDTTAYLDKRDRLPADLAAEHGHLATMQAIIRGNLDYGINLLVAASSAGQLLVVEYLLRNKVDPNGEDIASQRPLPAAAANGWNSVVHTLLNHHANVNLVDSERRTPLHHVAKNGRKDVALTLLTYKSSLGEAANVNAPDSSRYTPLHWAALEGHVDVMRLLLDHGANIHARSREQETPLHLAVQNTKAVELLLDRGAELEGKDIMDQTPLLKAVRNKCLTSVRLLLDRGASMNVCDNDGNNALHYAISQNEVSIVKEILKRCNDQDTRRDWNNLELAVRSTALDVLKLLMDKIPDAVKMKDDRERTLLNLAAGLESLQMLTLLLEAGSDVNHQGRWDRTPLLEAVSADRVENIRKLVDWKADVDIRDDEGDTALCFAVYRGNLEVVKVLIEAKASVDEANDNHITPLYRAAYNGHVEIVHCLLEAHANPNISAKDTWSPLHAAADNLEISRALIDHDADVNYQKDDKWSPLHLSASWGVSEVVRLLLERGADPNLVNDNGRTPLHLAVRSNKGNVLDVLLAHQGDITVNVNKSDKDGVTAIHTAITECSSEEVKKLIDHGAEVNVELADGTTYLDVAIEHNLSGTLATLLGVDGPSASDIPWDFEYLVSAYWRAVKKGQADTVEALVKKKHDLINQISTEGFNGLETYLRSSREGYDEEPLSVKFVNLGLDPFKRRQGQQLSCFELGIVSRRQLKMEFMEACLNCIPRDVRASNLGFKELRIAAEIDAPDFWTELAPLVEEVEEEIDQDGWNIHHFLYQATPRRIYASYKETALRKTRTPTALLWPHLWQGFGEDVGTSVEISADGLEASFAAQHEPGDLGAITIRADFPFPPRQLGITYFELSILQMTNEAKSEDSRNPGFMIGLSGEFTNQVYANPGWNVWSLGYHGDDGGIYENSSSPIEVIKPYGVGQTIGCGVDYKRGEYFFTCDGEIVFRKSSKLIFRKLYPVIGHYSGPGKVRVNFGKVDFTWLEANTARPISENLKPTNMKLRRSPTEQAR